MAAPINNYIKLRDVVLMYSEAAKQSASTFLRLWRICFRGFQQMGLNSMWQSKDISIVVNANKTATLPDDFIQWVKIGNFNDVGELQVLKVNENLTNFKDTSSNRLGDIVSEVGSLTTNLLYDNFTGLELETGDNYYNRQNFSVGSRLLTVGECSVDIANRVILLNTDFPYAHVILKYISAPEQDGDYQIPIQFQEAMIAWLYWQEIQYMPAINKGSSSQKQQAAQNFSNQLKLARKMYKPIRVQDIALQAKEAQSYTVN